MSTSFPCSTPSSGTIMCIQEPRYEYEFPLHYTKQWNYNVLCIEEPRYEYEFPLPYIKQWNYNVLCIKEPRYEYEFPLPYIKQWNKWWNKNDGTTSGTLISKYFVNPDYLHVIIMHFLIFIFFNFFDFWGLDIIKRKKKLQSFRVYFMHLSLLL